MTTNKPTTGLLAVLVQAAVLLGGCASQSITASLPQNIAPGEPSRVAGSPSTVYELIAAGANTCWFSPTGQLKKTHIFHADAESPAKGGAVDIAIQEHDVANAKPWGVRAFRIALKASDEQTVIEVENLKLPEPTAAQMRADVFNWAQGGKGCQLKPAAVEVAKPAAQNPAKKAKVNAAKAAP